VLAEAMDTIGAKIMGRGMFGGGPGPWDESWTGWWGDDPPFRMPASSSPTIHTNRCRCRAKPPSRS
jgi:hypothetical protein